MEKMYYFYIPNEDVAPLGIVESLLKEDFIHFYNEAVKYFEEQDVYMPNLQLTEDLNKAFADVTVGTLA